MILIRYGCVSMEKMTTRKLILPLIVSLLIIVVEAAAHIEDLFPSVVFGVSIIYLFPVAPIIYGSITGNKIGSVIVGTLPIIGFYFYAVIVLIDINEISDITQAIDEIIYIGSFLIIGGFEGYFASKQKTEYLVVAVCLCILWVVIYLSGID